MRLLERALRGLIVLISLAIIGWSILFVFLHTNTAFNAVHRQDFAQYPFVRQILVLHNYGDARRDYLDSKRYHEFDITLLSFADTVPQKETKAALSRLSELTDENLVLREVSLPGTAADGYTATELSRLDTSLGTRTSPGHAALNIFFVTRNDEVPSNAGMTVNEDGMALFRSSYHADAGAAAIEISTIYHEFGHQLSLEHEPGSVMAADADIINGQLPADELWYSAGELARIRVLRNYYAGL